MKLYTSYQISKYIGFRTRTAASKGIAPGPEVSTMKIAISDRLAFQGDLVESLMGADGMLWGADAIDDGYWQTMVFTVLTLSQMAHVMAIRSETDALWRVGLLSNRPLLGAVLLTFALQMAVVYVPALNPIFKTEPLSLAELGICLGAAVVVAVAVEIEKAWRRNRAGGLALSADDPA